MARHNGFVFNDETLSTPPPIEGIEVSAKWKRTWKGEVIMTVVMPHDVIYSEIYIKTLRGHTGIQMDPWFSSTWRRTWSNSHSPNQVTKEKIRKFRQERTSKRISLYKTAERCRQLECGHWSPRPDRKQQPKFNRKQQHHPYSLRTHSPGKQQQLNHVRQQNSCTRKQPLRKRVRKMSSTDSLTDSATSKLFYGKTDITDAVHSIDLSPQSPPEYKKGLKLT